MTETRISSASKEIIIGFDHPFCVIGERINPTNRKRLSEEMKGGDYSRVEIEAIAQVEAGATMLDVNAGIPLADEPKILADCIRLIQSITNVPLSIDSSIVDALEAGLSVYQGKPLVNSVTGEDEVLERVLPLVKKSMGRLSSRFQMTRPGFPKTRTSVSRWQRKLSNVPPTSELVMKTSSLTPSSCRPVPWPPPVRLPCA